MEEQQYIHGCTFRRSALLGRSILLDCSTSHCCARKYWRALWLCANKMNTTGLYLEAPISVFYYPWGQLKSDMVPKLQYYNRPVSYLLPPKDIRGAGYLAAAVDININLAPSDQWLASCGWGWRWGVGWSQKYIAGMMTLSKRMYSMGNW